MPGLARSLAAAAALGILAAGPALADDGYEHPTTTTSSTTTSSTTSTTTGATTTTAPPPVNEEAEVSDATAEPGQPVTVATPSGGTGFDAGDTVSAGIARGAAGQEAILLDSAVVNPDGTVSITVTIPEETPTGIYYVFIVGQVTIDGETFTKVVVAPITVSGAAADANAATLMGASSGDSGSSGSGSGGPAAATWAAGSTTMATPPEVAVLQSSITSPGEEQVILEAVADGATLSIDDGQLAVSTGPLESGAAAADSTRPLVAALAVGLAGGGLVLIRRRTPSLRRAR